MPKQKILSASQIRALDQQTIALEPISSIDLMERASRAFVKQFCKDFKETEQHILIIAGPGNNGGDALAVARMLHEAAYHVSVIVANFGQRTSDQQQNLQRLKDKRVIPLSIIQADDELPKLEGVNIFIDGLFGAGLNRPVSGYWATLLDHLNQAPVVSVAIDVPSGLYIDQASTGSILRADYTYTFQLPKLAFFAPENADYLGKWTVLDIGLYQEALAAKHSSNYHFPSSATANLLKKRGRFDHKGTFGHALIIAGSYGKIGAAILSARAALRAGCGLVTTHLPVCGYPIMQIAFPEAMVQVDRHREVFTTPPDLTTYAAVGIGPGLGTNALTKAALLNVLENTEQPLVLDADALNILGEHPSWQAHIPPDSILTPHPKEFARLFGEQANSFDCWQTLREQAQRLQCYILLKGGNSVVATPQGDLNFLTVGNPGMGTAGAGDVLTGVLCGLLAQGYSSVDTLLLGVCLHGIAGDIAAAEQEMESVIAEDIINYLGRAFAKLRKDNE